MFPELPNHNVLHINLELHNVGKNPKVYKLALVYMTPGNLVCSQRAKNVKIIVLKTFQSHGFQCDPRPPADREVPDS
jgi:hypothetical protein